MSASAPQDFSAIYTNANLAADATPYDSELLTSLVRRLEEVDGGSIREAAPAILVTRRLFVAFTRQSLKLTVNLGSNTVRTAPWRCCI